MRTLTRLLEGVNRFSLTTNRAMTVPLLKEWILREGGNVG
jgi:chromosomal replication initiation ATPase DnaA